MRCVMVLNNGCVGRIVFSGLAFNALVLNSLVATGCGGGSSKPPQVSTTTTQAPAITAGPGCISSSEQAQAMATQLLEDEEVVDRRSGAYRLMTATVVMVSSSSAMPGSIPNATAVPGQPAQPVAPANPQLGTMPMPLSYVSFQVARSVPPQAGQQVANGTQSMAQPAPMAGQSTMPMVAQPGVSQSAPAPQAPTFVAQPAPGTAQRPVFAQPVPGQQPMVAMPNNGAQPPTFVPQPPVPGAPTQPTPGFGQPPTFGGTQPAPIVMGNVDYSVKQLCQGGAQDAFNGLFLSTVTPESIDRQSGLLRSRSVTFQVGSVAPIMPMIDELPQVETLDEYGVYAYGDYGFGPIGRSPDSSHYQFYRSGPTGIDLIGTRVLNKNFRPVNITTVLHYEPTAL